MTYTIQVHNAAFWTVCSLLAADPNTLTYGWTIDDPDGKTTFTVTCLTADNGPLPE